MKIPDVKEKWSGRVSTVTIGATEAEGGTRGRTVTIGGASGIPFLSFDGEMPNPPAIAMEVFDKEPAAWPKPLEDVYGDVWPDPPAWARRAKELGADLVNLRLVSTHPDEGNRSPQQAVETVQAVLDYASPGARLVFSCGWHITRDGQDAYSPIFLMTVKVVGWIARLFRAVDLNDQVEACRRVLASHTRWTVVRGSDLEEGDSQGLPVWSRHVGDPILKSNITRRVDFALFMVKALENDDLIHEAPAIVGCKTPSAVAHGADK